MKELIKGINPIDALIELNGTKTDGESIKMDLSCNNPCPPPPPVPGAPVAGGHCVDCK